MWVKMVCVGQRGLFVFVRRGKNEEKIERMEVAVNYNISEGSSRDWNISKREEGSSRELHPPRTSEVDCRECRREK